MAKLVSSTPMVCKKPRLCSHFDADELSPITTLNTAAELVKQNVRESRSAAQKKIVKTAIPRKNDVGSKKTRSAPIQKNEPASNVCLREMGVKAEDLASNVLSISRSNMFNKYPQLIILDSDEEDYLPKTTAKQPSKPKLSRKQTSLNRKASSASTIVKATDVKTTVNVKKDKTINLTKTPLEDKKMSRMNIQETPRQLQTSRLRDNLRSSRTKQPLLAIPTNVSIDKSTTVPSKSNTTRNNKFKLSLLEAISEKKIKWTLRSKKHKTDSEKEDDISSESELTSTGSAASIVCINDDTVDHIKDKNQFPKGIISRFEDIVFRPHSVHLGCLIAPSLNTPSLSFGFIEVKEGSTFYGNLKDMTYMMLEGHLKVTYNRKTQQMSPGDLFHTSDSSGYKFNNEGPSFARVLYVKEKRT